jgi:4-hydroxybenzoate polyprenyltransferase
VINILYSIWLKKVPVIDIMMVASGFLLRAIAGAFVINVVITNWFLVCIFMISLMIESIKRRGEISIKSEHRRSVLKLYNAEILDLFVALSSISSLITYCIFALNYKIKYFYITIPVVIYWMMRYLYVSYRNREQSESPDEVLISDIHIIITSILYFVAVGISMFVLG